MTGSSILPAPSSHISLEKPKLFPAVCLMLDKETLPEKPSMTEIFSTYKDFAESFPRDKNILFYQVRSALAWCRYLPPVEVYSAWADRLLQTRTTLRG